MDQEGKKYQRSPSQSASLGFLKRPVLEEPLKATHFRAAPEAGLWTWGKPRAEKQT